MLPEFPSDRSTNDGGLAGLRSDRVDGIREAIDVTSTVPARVAEDHPVPQGDRSQLFTSDRREE
jgi:hypothetical protein